jgi:hypothetical protein
MAGKIFHRAMAEVRAALCVGDAEAAGDRFVPKPPPATGVRTPGRPTSGVRG